MPGFRIQTYLHQCCNDRLFLLFATADTMDIQAFADDLAHRHARAETAERVLEHHLHLPA
ncbi:hypothetical protein D3C81_2171930 [compost metagenome]